MHELLPVILACVLVAGVGIYVCLDGMDLGIGILYLVAPRESDRDVMMSTVEALWDGNETWLVLGAMILYAGFPGALYVLLPALYLPIMGMLISLVMRGIAFEFRARSVESRRAWDRIFSLASMGAAICQGLILGTFVSGSITPGQVKPFEFLSWFSVATAIGLLIGYGLLGSTWLIWRTSGSAQIFAREITRPLLLALAVFIVLVSVWTPLAQVHIAQRWFSWPNIGWLAMLPAATVLSWIALWKSIWGKDDSQPYVFAIAIFVLCLIGLCVSVYPYAVPGHITLWQAASRPATQSIVGIGLAICLPFGVAYLCYSYWIFKGKVGSRGDY